MSLPPLLAVLAAGTALSWLLTGQVLAYLRRRAILDRPNERSSHKVPTPRGGGWGIMLTLLPLWALIAAASGTLGGTLPVLGAAAGLMAVSWIDDRRGLAAAPRFLAQIAAVAAGLATLPAERMVFQDLLPFWADRAAAAFVWLWFVNLYNFMDGIDGLAGGETVSVGLGIAIVGAVAGLDPAAGAHGVAAAGAALGFLVWNWHPAKLFMGDVGSIPLGYALGWLLLGLAAAGAWAAALLLPAVFLTDATVTLLRRAAAGKRIWQAHREHAYQRATQHGRTHAQVVRAVLLANAVLVLLAVASLSHAWPALAAGGVLVVTLLALLARPLRATA